MAERMADHIREWGGEIRTGEKVTALEGDRSPPFVFTEKGRYEAVEVVSCAGLHSDRVARMTDPDLDIRITPFRGEYFELVESKRHLIKHLIYPVPDPAFPFLGVHFTRMIGGGVEAGPNAVLALGREAYHKWKVNPRDLWETVTWPGFQKVALKYWKMGAGEFYRSWWKPAFVKALQRLVPDVQGKDLVACPAGNRAQACARDGGLLDDFHIVEHAGIHHVCNAPSPAATASLAIGNSIVARLGLKGNTETRERRKKR
jgi:L-2-hydroxyglutarate oxidase